MRVLVAGIGNIFFGDDAFGPEVANRLLTRPVPQDVHLGEYGIRGLHLALDLLDGYDVLVLIDALPMAETPGTVTVIEVDPTDLGGDGSAPMDAHSMSPVTVLGLLANLGGQVGRVLVVGCEPAVIDQGIGLSPVVEAAVPFAVDAVSDLLTELCSTINV